MHAVEPLLLVPSLAHLATAAGFVHALLVRRRQHLCSFLWYTGQEKKGKRWKGGETMKCMKGHRKKERKNMKKSDDKYLYLIIPPFHHSSPCPHLLGFELANRLPQPHDFLLHGGHKSKMDKRRRRKDRKSERERKGKKKIRLGVEKKKKSVSPLLVHRGLRWPKNRRGQHLP